MSDRPRRIVYLSGTRADFGLMLDSLLRIARTPVLSLQVLVTGMHLSADHGRTIDEIRASGLPVLAEIPLDMATRSGRSMSLGIADCLRGVTEALAQDPPDVLLLLGDRGEMLAGAIAALHLGIACVHLHGGERSGTVDEPVRHAISKLATHHFVATPGSRDRLVAMGEAVDRIHVTGAPGLDGLIKLGQMPRERCLADLGLPAEGRFLLVLFHPVVQQAGDAYRQTLALAQGVAAMGLPVVWLEPNADAGAHDVLQALNEVQLPAGSRRITHLPRPLFAAALHHCAVLAGNSSSGIIEAASFGTRVLNIGDRQRLRERAGNVRDVPPEAGQVATALREMLEQGPGVWDNPYGDGWASERIAAGLASLPLDPSWLEKTNRY